MNIQNWKLYDKRGSNLNLYIDSYINLIFNSDVGKDTVGFAVTDPSEFIVDTYISNKGWGYDSNTTISLDYTFSINGLPIDIDASIFYIDISIFNPEPQNSQGINSVSIDLSTNFIYPSLTSAGSIFLNPVSQGLIETEHITIFEETSTGEIIRPWDASNSTLVFKMNGTENEISLFTIDDNTQEIVWVDEIVFDISTFIKNSAIQVDIGFKSNEEGVYERRLIACHRIGDSDYPLMEIVVNAHSIGKDERFNTLLDNFGLYKPENITQLFKESDINEDLPDWQLLNYKAKHLILEHDKIMPFIGTYKGLINAIKWLGYEDIKIKEWFKNVKENKKLSLEIPYDVQSRKRTILAFTPDERRHLKKLNQLSLVYCINRDTGENDEWGNTITENCYEYNLNEILVKLYSLKSWLEKNIIGVNAKIVDLTGEGVYYEIFKNYIYGTQNYGTNAKYTQKLTPETLSTNSELINGEASVGLTLKEYKSLNIEDIPSFLELARYGWDPSNGFFSPEDYYTLSYKDPSAVFIGAPIGAMFADLYDIQWKLSVEKTESGSVTDNFVTNPLLIYNNEIRFYNVYDTSSLFNCVDANVDITIETGYLRNPDNDIWEDSIAYSIYAELDSSDNRTGKWIFESSLGVIKEVWGEFSLQTSINPLLMYAYDDNYMVPLLSISGFKWTDTNGSSFNLDRNYFLDIVDGKIAMDSSILNYNGDTIDIRNFINFNYDTSLSEQKITLNVEYVSPRMPIFSYDPSDVSTMYYNGDSSISLIEDNSIYKIKVNHSGDYNIEIFGWNGQNNLFYNFDRDGYEIFQKYPTINSYIDTSCAGNDFNKCVSAYLTQTDISTLINENKYPVFDRIIPLQGLNLEYDIDNKPYLNIPSITYFQDIPENNSISRFYNLTERITSISGTNIVIDEDYQKFYLGDSVNLVQFDKGKYSFLKEEDVSITFASSPNFTISSAPVDFTNDISTQWYALNLTRRDVSNGVNDIINQTFTCDIENYSFIENQLVSLIIKYGTYEWGSSFRVINSSTGGFGGYRTHVLEGNIPEFVLNDPNYSLEAKHGFSAFSDFQINIDHAIENNNNFHIYLDDNYNHQYYLDNTFVFLNILFDQEYVLAQWYDPSTDFSLAPTYYPFNNSIELDISTLVILRAEYDISTYMLNQQNIWTIKKSDDKTTIMKVFNNTVPFIFNNIGSYDVIAESYDKYGNLKRQEFEGLILIK